MQNRMGMHQKINLKYKKYVITNEFEYCLHCYQKNGSLAHQYHTADSEPAWAKA